MHASYQAWVLTTWLSLFAVDISSFYLSQQTFLYCANLAQGACFFSCKYRIPSFFIYVFYACPKSTNSLPYFSVKASQFLRIITFYSTQLPGPNYHCREVTFSVHNAVFWNMHVKICISDVYEAIYCFLCRALNWQPFHHPIVYLKSFWLTVSILFCWVCRFLE